jgi:hypothetical protein
LRHRDISADPAEWAASSEFVTWHVTVRGIRCDPLPSSPST